VVVIFGGEGSQDGTLVYDPYQNVWARNASQGATGATQRRQHGYDAAHRVHVYSARSLATTAHVDLRPRQERVARHETARNRRRSQRRVLAYDAAAQLVVAIVRVVDQVEGMEIIKGHLETWAYDAARTSGGK